MAKEARQEKKKKGRGRVIRITQTSRPTLKVVSAIDGMTKKIGGMQIICGNERAVI